jgi:hypothetical protein
MGSQRDVEAASQIQLVTHSHPLNRSWRPPSGSRVGPLSILFAMRTLRGRPNPPARQRGRRVLKISSRRLRAGRQGGMPTVRCVDGPGGDELDVHGRDRERQKRYERGHPSPKRLWGVVIADPSSVRRRPTQERRTSLSPGTALEGRAPGRAVGLVLVGPTVASALQLVKAQRTYLFDPHPPRTPAVAEARGRRRQASCSPLPPTAPS